jgi:sn-glycerol 3-phosphate transport system permease protein
MRGDAQAQALAPPSGWRKVGRYALLVLLAFLVLFPVYATLMFALKPGTAIFEYPRALLPVDLTLDTLRDAWTQGNLGRYLFNSTLVSLAITAGVIVTSVLSAYAFSMLHFPGRNVLFLVYLATLLVPLEVTVLVNRKTMESWGWIDSYQALIVPFLASAFGTFLLRQVFLTLPGELREAASLDGVGHVGFLWDVAVPLARPTIGALALFSFLGAWNQYLWPLQVTNADDYRTVQIGLRSLAASRVDELNLVMAGTIIAAVPIFIVLLVFQRQLIRGLTAGAVKG